MNECFQIWDLYRWWSFAKLSREIKCNNQQAMFEEVKKSLYAATKNKDPINQVLQSRIESILLQKVRSENDSTVRILEIASGTGEHCNYFLSNLLTKAVNEDQKGCLRLRLDYQPTEPDLTMQDSIVSWSRDLPLPSSSDVSTEQTLKHISNHILFNPPIINNLSEVNIFAPMALDLQQYHDSPSGYKDQLLTHGYHEQSVDIMICINMIHITPLPITYYLFEFASVYLSDHENSMLITYGPYAIQGRMIESNQRFHEDLQRRNALWGIKDIELLKEIAGQYGMVLEEMIDMPSNNHCLIFKKKNNNKIE